MKRSSQNQSQKPARGAPRGSPEVIADTLLVRILRGDYPAGSRLPAERQLAAELGVDRTTLRMALKHLQRMNLVVARHGSGIEVNDFRVHGGLDVLAAIFALDELPLEGSFVVEALDFWLEIFSMTAAKAIMRMTLDDLRTVEKTLDDAIAARDDIDRFTALLIELTDALARLSGSVIFRMANNSTLSLRNRLTRLLPETVDVAAPLLAMRKALRNAALVRPSEDLVRTGFLEMLRSLTAKLREQLLFGAPLKTRRARRRVSPSS